MFSLQKILFIGFVWPEPNSSAAGSRIVELINFFQSEGGEVTFASPATNSEYMINLQQIGVEKVSIELNNESFDLFIQKLQPSIVVFDRFMIEEQFGWRIAEYCPKALRILDTEDLHCLRKARQTAFKEGRGITPVDLQSDVAKREIASILRCDLSLIISDVEIALLINQFNIDISLLHYLPFMLDPMEKSDTDIWPKFESRAHFITVGNFLHEPNWDSVQYLNNEVWPLIRKELSLIELHIYGAYPSQKVIQLHNPKIGFYIMGRTQNAKNVVRNARVCLTPLRFGAGIKGKLIEAMQCGTPSVTTDIGAEAMHGDLPWNGLIANNAKDIASAAIKLYKDESLWQKAQGNGIQIINSVYSKKRLSLELRKHIVEIQNNLTAHRSKNFTGAMLMHHTMTSTKYMSKWIEAKNSINQ